MEIIKAELLHSASIEKYDYLYTTKPGIFCQEKFYFVIYFFYQFHYNIDIMR